MVKSRVPVCLLAAGLGAGIYLTFSLLAYHRYPLAFSPGQNWLSDLGNQIENPFGAAFYNVGVILTALAQGVWFAGLSQWKLNRNTVQRRLLAISQLAGFLCSAALIMSALNPINLLARHSFWSQFHWMLSGIAFGFSVAALRYHPRATTGILGLGALASVSPMLFWLFGGASWCWMEWATVTLFILYLLAVGQGSRTMSRPASAAI